MDRGDYYLSGYKLMWMMVMFDLPVSSKNERKEAGDFRIFLKKQGFTMAQFSIYYKSLSGKEMIPKYENRIQSELPHRGQVDILCVTDKQFENVVSYYCREKNPDRKKTEQLLLF